MCRSLPQIAVHTELAVSLRSRHGGTRPPSRLLSLHPHSMSKARTGSRDLDDDVVWMLDLRHRHLFDFHLERALVVHRLHSGGLGRHLGTL